MANITLPIMPTFSAAWSRVYGSKLTFWKGIGCMVLIMLAVGLVKGALTTMWPSSESVVDIVGQVINYLLQMGLVFIGIQRAFDRPINYEMIFNVFKIELSIKIICLYFLEVIIFLIPVAIFFISLVIQQNYPDNTGIMIGAFTGYVISGILFLFLLIRITLAMGFLLDKNQNPWIAIKSSFKATRDNFWRLLIVHFLFICLIVVSALPLCIGLIWTLPLGFILYGVMYKTLLPNAMG